MCCERAKRLVSTVIRGSMVIEGLTLRVQVPNYHILTQNLYYNYYYPNPKYLNFGYMDPLGDKQNKLQNRKILGDPAEVP